MTVEELIQNLLNYKKETEVVIIDSEGCCTEIKDTDIEEISNNPQVVLIPNFQTISKALTSKLNDSE